MRFKVRVLARARVIYFKEGARTRRCIEETAKVMLRAGDERGGLCMRQRGGWAIQSSAKEGRE